MPWVWQDDENDEPTMGVREPRRPMPHTPSTGAALEPPRDDYREAQTLAESPRVVVDAAA